MRKVFTILFLLGSFVLFGGNLTLVEKGKPAAVIVLPDKPNPVAKYAAMELNDHIRLITGTELEVISEKQLTSGKLPIFVGATSAAEKAGLGQKKFDKEAWAIRSTPQALYLTGGENDQELMPFNNRKYDFKETAIHRKYNGINPLARRGTLYSVTEFLQQVCGVRWLWPGELGTTFRAKSTLTIPDDLNISGAPRFLYRKWRIHGKLNRYLMPEFIKGRTKVDPVLDQINFSQKAHEAYFAAERRFIVRYQEGDSQPMPAPASHINDWYKQMKNTHPEFVAMNDAGERVPPPGKPNVSRLCVSAPDLPQWWVENKWDGGDWIGVGEADHRAFCRCKNCMEWDKPQDPNHKYYSTSNRYLRFHKKIWELARKKNPKVKVAILMYMDYTHPPTIEDDLSWIFGKFVPWGSGYASYYPMSKKELETIRQGWLGWGKRKATIHYRPNYLLSGYTIPALDVEQSGEMFRFGAKNGMVGFDFDSLSGYWATKGPMLYVHMRLSNDPDLTIETILNEYYSAFGPASGLIRKYFDHWIAVTKKVKKQIGFRNADITAEIYTVDHFTESGKILEEAIKLAEKSQDKKHLERVKFIQLGWLHGRMCVEFGHLYKDNQFNEARAKLNEIIKFRRKHEHTFFCDLAAASSAEKHGYKNLKALLEGKFRHHHEPALTSKKFRKKECHAFSDLKPSKWGLSLPGNKESGFVIYKYNAGKNNAFVEADLSLRAHNTRINNQLDISFDGKNWQKVEENIARKNIRLTGLVKDKSEFYLRFTAKRNDKTPEKGGLALISYRLDYTKKNPDVIPPRKQIDTVTGWLDFNPRWFFKKDPHNKGLAKSEMDVKTFSGKNWTPVSVPAPLETTPVGPYLGFGWYSTVFEVKKDWEGRSIDLLFTGIDKEGWVYFNGHYVGEHTVKSENVSVRVLYGEPFIIKVPAKYINFGGKNLLQVKIHSGFGSSGIWNKVKFRPVDASAL